MLDFLLIQHSHDHFCWAAAWLPANSPASFLFSVLCVLGPPALTSQQVSVNTTNTVAVLLDGN